MMKFNLMVAAAATALALGATAAQAGTGVYTLSGEWNGSFNGVAFRGTGFTFTMTGDTSLVGDVNPANFVDPDVQFLNTLESTTVKLDGFGTFTLLDGTHLAARIAGGEAVFDQYEPNDRNLFIWDNTAPVDLTKSFGPIVSSLSEVISDIIPTTGGDLQFDEAVGGPTLTFSGVVTGGVPEPASWALMLSGFFGLGGLLRHRRATVGLA
jgi:hypothetical protein